MKSTLDEPPVLKSRRYLSTVKHLKVYGPSPLSQLLWLCGRSLKTPKFLAIHFGVSMFEKSLVSLPIAPRKKVYVMKLWLFNLHQKSMGIECERAVPNLDVTRVSNLGLHGLRKIGPFRATWCTHNEIPAPDSIDWWESPWATKKKTTDHGNPIRFWLFLLWWWWWWWWWRRWWWWTGWFHQDVACTAPISGPRSQDWICSRDQTAVKFGSIWIECY